ncbi:MAG TPA: copper amine oxidase N-terminal domain-containing protein [Candidatus Dormibacteraeota bacterium]|nr:copper amine oxidase N-terminal domain-containing protein [Candidatus Dormibacteraeota bacterium]
MTYALPSVKLLALTTVIALVASIGLFVSRPVTVVVDGARLESDVPPVTTAPDDVYVPLRSIADALGARTFFDRKTGRVVVVRGSDALRLRVGDVHATLDGMRMTLDHSPFQVRGRVMVGLHTIARAFGVRVSYDPVAGRVNVMTPGIGEAPPAANLTSVTQ